MTVPVFLFKTKMQQQELAQMRQRDANLTALAAIGPRKKRKVDSPAPGSGVEVPHGCRDGGWKGLGASASRSPLQGVRHAEHGLSFAHMLSHRPWSTCFLGTFDTLYSNQPICGYHVSKKFFA